jgi:hypothetical protein
MDEVKNILFLCEESIQANGFLIEVTRAEEFWPARKEDSHIQFGQVLELYPKINISKLKRQETPVKVQIYRHDFRSFTDATPPAGLSIHGILISYNALQECDFQRVKKALEAFLSILEMRNIPIVVQSFRSVLDNSHDRGNTPTFTENPRNQVYSPSSLSHKALKLFTIETRSGKADETVG